jgi:micrococcal nuclease
MIPGRFRRWQGRRAAPLLDRGRPTAVRSQVVRLQLLAVALAAMTLAGCSDGDGPAAPTSQPPTTTPPETTQFLPVTRVVDGDTVIVSGYGSVRLIGVDTPETVDPDEPVGCFGPEASAFTRQLLTARMVRLEFDVDRTDRYGRTLAYLYMEDGTLVNAQLILQGYGYAYTVFPFRYLDQFRTYEREAREAGRGLWSACPVR